jgi:uncharacterized protein (TIGR02145 family)
MLRNFSFLLFILPCLLISCNEDDANEDNPNELFLDSRDGEYYEIVDIYGQCWFVENLRYEPSDYYTPDSVEWANNWNNREEQPAWCHPLNDEELSQTLGVYYNWYAVENGNLCPNGWHVPSNQDWELLTENLGGRFEAGKKLKDTLIWQSSESDGVIMATNESGFTARPAGDRVFDASFRQISWSSFDDDGYWWSSDKMLGGDSIDPASSLAHDTTEYAYYRSLHSGSAFGPLLRWGLKVGGFPCRCIKD